MEKQNWVTFAIIVGFIASIITIITFFAKKNANVTPVTPSQTDYKSHQQESSNTNPNTTTNSTTINYNSNSSSATNTSSSNKIVLDSYGSITVYTISLPRGGTTLYVHNSSSTCYNVQLDYFLQGSGYIGWFYDPGSAYVCGGGSDYEYAYSSEGITDARIAKLTEANN